MKKIQTYSIEFIICKIINCITATWLAVMVAFTVIAWVSLVTVLTPSAPDIARVRAARVLWSYIESGDALRKELFHE